jgi:hypothetical protein
MMAGLHWLADVTGTAFRFWIKIPGVLGDVAAIWLAATLVRQRRWLVWVVVLNPASLLISSYHGNTDALCAAASFFACCFMTIGRVRLSAVALGIALNVKLFPAALVLALLGCCTDLRRLRIYVSWLAPFALPFVVALLVDRQAFVRNVLDYNAILGPWGINYFTLATGGHDHPAGRFATTYLAPSARFLILGASAWFGALHWWRGRFTPLELGALALGTSLVFVPGFGIQYMIYPLLPMLVTRPREATELVAVSGVLVFATYAHYWTGDFPIRSRFRWPWPGAAELGIGLIVWYSMARTTLLVYVRGRRGQRSTMTAG